MSGPALQLAGFIAVVALILLTVWLAMVLEAGEQPPAGKPDAVQPGAEPGEKAAPERKAA